MNEEHRDAGERLAKIKAGIKAADKRKPKSPRPAVTYRGARRNIARARGWNPPMHRIGDDVREGWSPGAELNRSQNWTRAKTYAYAREISPYPERPVR
ncbi:hypothetical protein PMI42_01688 [Bradyrhizobium sp. YR681]|uniref:hypothetical protein n=1 Tax=Bradyrhizobium sp. YR681 TaxID=1144344 RepID=UPI0002712A3B|nr:hypothetical protein [Bradyrhizobium sp. YR681]EJN14715.1 hypothetical protein PMI42_01688 [Bradyrhizobium sp. YR681]